MIFFKGGDGLGMADRPFIWPLSILEIYESWMLAFYRLG